MTCACRRFHLDQGKGRGENPGGCATQKMGRNPKDDAGFMRLSRQLDELKASHNTIFETLKTGYLEKKKFEAQPDSTEVQELKRSLSESMQESENLLRWFEEMQLEKVADDIFRYPFEGRSFLLVKLHHPSQGYPAEASYRILAAVGAAV